MDGREVFDHLGLTEYEATALDALLGLGRTTAPNLAEATGIPKARIYGVLEELANRGFLKVIPARPKQYQARSPEAILERAVENERQAFEAFRSDLDDEREAFLAEYRPQFEAADEDVTPTEELFAVVDVGEPSETETRRLYHEAAETISVVTKSFEYLDRVEDGLAAARDRGVTVDVLFLHPDHLSEDNRGVQADRVDRLQSQFSGVGTRFSTEPLPLRGTIVDPSMGYETGEAIVLTEEKDVPLSMRQAALTENGSFVAGLQRYVDLIWEHESTEYPG